MSNIKKLVIYTSPAELDKHAANYPCLVNYHTPTKTGVIDDGCGHSADVTFASMTCEADMAKLPAGPFDNVVLVGFGFPRLFTKAALPAETPADTPAETKE